MKKNKTESADLQAYLRSGIYSEKLIANKKNQMGKDEKSKVM